MSREGGEREADRLSRRTALRVGAMFGAASAGIAALSPTASADDDKGAAHRHLRALPSWPRVGLT